MFLFKYERFIHDFVGFDGCLLDSETKSKERVKWSFFQDFRHPLAHTSIHIAWANKISSSISNQLTWASYSSPRRIGAFSTKS